MVSGTNPEFGMKRLPRRPVAESAVILIAKDLVPVTWSTDMTRLIGFHVAGSDVPRSGCYSSHVAVTAQTRSPDELPPQKSILSLSPPFCLLLWFFDLDPEYK